MRARAIFVAAGIFRPADSGRTEYVLRLAPRPGGQLQQAELQAVIDELQGVTHAPLEGLQSPRVLHMARLVDVASVLLAQHASLPQLLHLAPHRFSLDY